MCLAMCNLHNNIKFVVLHKINYVPSNNLLFCGYEVIIV